MNSASQQNPITVRQFFDDQKKPLELELIAGSHGMDRPVREPTINRPGLALAGFTRYFARNRIQVIGNAESYFLRTLTPEERVKLYRVLFGFKIPCVIFSRGLQPGRFFLKEAEMADVPVFKCPLITMKMINLATLALEELFAPRGTLMGSMVDILGIGVIIKGESGIGKSENVLALLERGYSLVADDITKVRLLDGKEVIGTSNELMRGHMEVRGLGIINVASLFGIRAIRKEKRVDLVVTLKSWEKIEDVERVGMDDTTIDVLGIPIPHIILPVKPGRDLARLIEVAAFQTKLKVTGYNPAKELNERLISQMTQNKPF